MIIKRLVKGEELTYEEIDNNFQELDTAIASKANSADVFTKSEVTAGYAPKNGNTGNEFSVKNATADQHAFPKKQAETAIATAVSTAVSDASTALENQLRYNSFVVTGTADDIVLTLQVGRVGVTAIQPGTEVNFIAASNNTGACTVTVNFGTETLTTKAITKIGLTPLEADDIKAGAAYKLFWDGTRFQMFSGTASSGGAVDLSDYYTKSEIDAKVSTCRIPVGFIMAYPVKAIPTGYVAGKGQLLLIANFPDLFAVVGHIFKLPNETVPLGYFRIAELRANYLSGLDDGADIDKTIIQGNLTSGSAVASAINFFGNTIGVHGAPPVGALKVSGAGIQAGTTITNINWVTNQVTLSKTATASATGASLTVTGRLEGTQQVDEFRSHTHTGSPTNQNLIGGASGAFVNLNTQPLGPSSAVGGPSTHPRNIPVVFCFKAFDVITPPVEVDYNSVINAAVDVAVNSKVVDKIKASKVGDKITITGTYVGATGGVISFASKASLDTDFVVTVQRTVRPAGALSLNDFPTISAKTATSFTITGSTAITSSWTYDYIIVGTGTLV